MGIGRRCSSAWGTSPPAEQAAHLQGALCPAILGGSAAGGSGALPAAGRFGAPAISFEAPERPVCFYCPGPSKREKIISAISINATRLVEVHARGLSFGTHKSWDDGASVMEAVAWVVTGERWGDHPPCVCPVIGAFLRTWNDELVDAERDRLLLPFVERVPGTSSTPLVEEDRGWLAMDWLVRTYAPGWLRLAGLTEFAAVLEALPPVTSDGGVLSAKATLDAAQDAAASTAASVREKIGDSQPGFMGRVVEVDEPGAVWREAKRSVWEAIDEAGEEAALKAAAQAGAGAAEKAAETGVLGAPQMDGQLAAMKAAGSAAWAVATSSAWTAAQGAAEASVPAAFAVRRTALEIGFNSVFSRRRIEAFLAARDSAARAALSAGKIASYSSLDQTRRVLQLSAVQLLDRMIDAT